MFEAIKILFHIFKRLTRSFRERRFRNKFLFEDAKREKYPSKLSTVSQIKLYQNNKAILAVRVPFATSNQLSAFAPGSLNPIEFQTLANSEKCRYFEITKTKPVRVLMINWTLKENQVDLVANHLADFFTVWSNSHLQTIHIDGTFIRCTLSADATELSRISVDKLKLALKDLSNSLSDSLAKTSSQTESKITVISRLKSLFIFLLTVFTLGTLLVVNSVYITLVFSPQREIFLIAIGLLSVATGIIVYRKTVQGYLWTAALKSALFSSFICMLISFISFRGLDYYFADKQISQDVVVDQVKLVEIKKNEKFKMVLSDGNNQLSDTIFISKKRNPELYLKKGDLLRIVTKIGILKDQYILSLCRVQTSTECTDINLF